MVGPTAFPPAAGLVWGHHHSLPPSISLNPLPALPLPYVGSPSLRLSSLIRLPVSNGFFFEGFSIKERRISSFHRLSLLPTVADLGTRPLSGEATSLYWRGFKWLVGKSYKWKRNSFGFSKLWELGSKQELKQKAACCI